MIARPDDELVLSYHHSMLVSSFTSPFAPLHDTSVGLVNRVCPLFVMKGPRQPYLVGTGVPMQIGSVSVIATAAHVLRQVGQASVLTFTSSGAIVLAGERRGFGHRKGRFADVDLAVIVLSESEREQLRERLTFSYSIERASLQPANETAFYTLIGFPHSRNKASPRLLAEPYAEAAYFIMHKRVPIATVKSDDKFAPVHFALSAPSRAVLSPAGLSGGGIWWLDTSRSLTVAPVPKLVGIGIEYCRKPGAFVCTRIRELDTMVSDLHAPARQVRVTSVALLPGA
jgi:hypothetical protein